MKKIIIILGILLAVGIQTANSENQTEISLLTCSGGDEIFAAWGHSALRVTDKSNSSDLVFNFGLFDFDTPNFSYKFVKGNLKYKLGVHKSNLFIDSYTTDGQQVIEQVLNLSDETETQIIERLKFLYQPENRYYYYSFLDKNCTTELRDLLLNNTSTDFKAAPVATTQRVQINEYLQDKLWLKFGMNLLLGPSLDREINSFETMFLPAYLCNGLTNINVDNASIIAKEIIHNPLEEQEVSYPFLINPLFVFSLLLLVALLVKSSKLQLAYLLVTGLTGLVIFMVWIITDHQELKSNFNLLWCSPLYLLSVFFQWKKKIKLQYYLSGLLQLLILTMAVIWITNMQGLDFAYIIVAITLSVYNFRIIKTGLKVSS